MIVTCCGTHSTSVCLYLQFLGFSTSNRPSRMVGRQECLRERGRTCRERERERVRERECVNVCVREREGGGR